MTRLVDDIDNPRPLRWDDSSMGWQDLHGKWWPVPVEWRPLTAEERVGLESDCDG